MTGTEGETAVIALAICAVTPWALFLARIWKVSTAAKPKKPDVAAETVAPAEPLHEARTEAA